MGMFNKKKQAELPDPIWQEDEPAEVTYESVVEWLVGLSDEDYTKVCEVVKVYRQAEKDVAIALGVTKEPTAFINMPEPETAPEPAVDEPEYMDMLADEDKPKNESPKNDTPKG